MASDSDKKTACEPAEAALWPGLTSGRILLAGCVVSALLLVRIAVMHNPGFLAAGPAGHDRRYYYYYTRSLVIDGDLDFTNEIARIPPTGTITKFRGKHVNKYAFGMSFLTIPAFAVTHGTVRVLNRLGLSQMPDDGYAWPYVYAFGLNQFLLGIAGIWLISRTLREFFSPGVSAMAAVAAWLGTNAVLQTSIDVMMAHSASIFSVAWCTYESVRLRSEPSRWQRWCRLGAASALAVTVRYQNAVYMLVPVVAAVQAFVLAARARKAWRLLWCVPAAAVCFAVAFGPQLFVWKSMFGTWLANTYGGEAGRFDFLAPKVAEVLLDFRGGLGPWLVAVALGLAGCCVLAIRRRDPLIAAAALAFVGQIYIAAAWWDWRIVQRTTFDYLFPIAAGLGVVIAWLARRNAALPVVFALCLIAWGIPQVVGVVSAEADGLVGQWLAGLRALL